MEIVVERMDLGTVVLPPAHPRAADGTCTIGGFLVRHPDGPILVDTGVADDHQLLNDLYRPRAVPIVTALNAHDVDERDLVAIVNTHLHFDHCGQNRFLATVPVFAQRAEIAMIDEPHYTIPEWAHTEPERLREVDGDAEIAPGVRLVATPGHTPGHQSVVVESGAAPVVIVGQCCYRSDEFESGRPAASDMHDESFLDVGCESLARLRALDPSQAHFSHDRTVFGR